ncbi:MAG: hypothetical protein KQ78_01011 [Candidatus Izimaplasma bacterium HR2]|nr:MAG: hypothetical protein KQ78_01011 [Candidatus Izimaplasma bacterium HR2]
MHNKILTEIEKRAIDFFQHHTNFNEDSLGYGLTQDNSIESKRASIAATGFMLSSLIIGVENGYLSKYDSLYKARKTLKTLLLLENHEGFFAHFIEIKTGKRWNFCEFSTIDTAICLAGVLSVDVYFNDSEIKEMAAILFKRVNWESFVEIDENIAYIRMAYNPSAFGDYVGKIPGFISRWDMFAEQLIMYPMIAGSIKDHVLAKNLYKGFARKESIFSNRRFYSSPHNTLFVYHMPLCWLDIKDYIDSENINWESNARLATMCHQLSSVQVAKIYKTFSKNTFGMNASDTIEGYRVFGALPNAENTLDTDGTIAPYSIVCSLPYLFEDAIEGVNQMKKIPGLFQEYGFLDAYNKADNNMWISNKYIAIDKGMELLSVNQLTSNIVRKCFMENTFIKKGLEVLDWKKEV